MYDRDRKLHLWKFLMQGLHAYFFWNNMHASSRRAELPLCLQGCLFIGPLKKKKIAATFTSGVQNRKRLRRVQLCDHTHLSNYLEGKGKICLAWEINALALGSSNKTFFSRAVKSSKAVLCPAGQCLHMQHCLPHLEEHPESRKEGTTFPSKCSLLFISNFSGL